MAVKSADTSTIAPRLSYVVCRMSYVEDKLTWLSEP